MEKVSGAQASGRWNSYRLNLHVLRILAGFTLALLFINNLSLGTVSRVIHSKKENFKRCAIDTYLATGLKFLEGVERPPIEEYMLRRDNLANALVADGIDAFVAEPGYAFSYYANVSQSQWEPWEPEERPFLMVIRPSILDNGSVVANTSFLVPYFEEERAKLLGMPFREEISTIVYKEHWNYYTSLWEAPMWGEKLSPVLMVDEEIRDYISRGLASNGFTVVGLAGNVENVRQIKTEREIEILRAVNTGTVEAIRAMRKCLYRGVTENEVAYVLDSTLEAVGFETFFDLVEFGKSAALPHGGYDGTRQLVPGDFILIDVGAHLFGYSSDVTRTFFPPFYSYPPPNHDNLTEQLHVWQIVQEAQRVSVEAMLPNVTAASVDIAAREIIEAAGYGRYFTHRIGHSIGIKAHESPYLNKGNFISTLKPGMVFTSEPGVYILDRFGVRHEDVLVVRSDGEAENISGGFAKSAWEP